MKPERRELIAETDIAMRICSEIEFILTILSDYCEYNEDSNRKFLGVTLISKLLLEKNRGLYNLIDKVQRDMLHY
ncbi:MAG: hypothetical protein NC390_01925 [Fusobacterium sp.]|nr:hypothetical protein [Fusobacterium sp.]